MPRNALAAGGVFEPDPGNALAPPPSMADAMDWHRQNMREAWAAAQNPQTWQDAADQYRSGMLMGSVAPEMKGLGLDAAAMKVLRDMTPGFRAYHGSPHSFDQFSSGKIGTGEGAQAYGHGLYFADSEDVARSYRDSLSPPGVVVTRNGQPVGALANSHIVNDPQYVAAYNTLMPDPGVLGWIKSGIMRDIHGLGDTGQNIDLDTARQASIARMTKEMAQFSPEQQQRAIASINQAYDSIGGDVQFRRPGHMYEVNVAADPAHFLDWDKPIAEQPPNVQAKIRNLAMRGIGARNPDPAMTGGEWYVDTQAGGHKSADIAAHLHAPLPGEVDPAIPGIRYLDGSSRAGGEGTRNSVIFDANTIAILRKYGLAGLMAGGGAAASGQPQQ
jgi:hypothetical protein